MSYRCQICGKVTDTTTGMCGHIINAHDRFEEHWEWIESHGISFPETVGLKGGKLGKGDYKALKDVVERECKIGG